MNTSSQLKESTHSKAGLSKEDVLTLVFTALLNKQNGITMDQIYEITNNELAKSGNILSVQGKATLRNLIYTVAPPKGSFIYKNKINNWELTKQGRDKLQEIENHVEEVIDETTGQTTKIQQTISNTVKGALLEEYVLGLLKKMYPQYTWYHQGINKNNERGLDLIGNKIGETQTAYNTIGVQIKNHLETNSPTDDEWQKFLAGCFLRHVDEAIFVTTGKLTSKQRREVGEAKIKVIVGKDELNRIAKQHRYNTYDKFLKTSDGEEEN